MRAAIRRPRRGSCRWCARSLRTDRRRPDWLVWHTLLLDRVIADASRVRRDPLPRGRAAVPAGAALPARASPPCTAGSTCPTWSPLYRHFSDAPLVSISGNQRKPLPFANWRGHRAPRPAARALPFNAEPRGDYFAFIGRISPEKRVDRAIEIALACGVPLRIAAKVDEVDRDYFASRIRPLLDHPLVEFIGEIDEKARTTSSAMRARCCFRSTGPNPSASS